MVHTKIGLNISALGNITAPTFDIPSTSRNWILQAIIKANEITKGYYGLINLSVMFLFLMWKLSDKGFSADFQYSKIRAMGIAGFMAGISGIFMLSLGLFTNLYHVVIFIVIGLIATLWTYIEEK